VTVARLLVSVRSVAEARSALAGGAEVIDVKEPSRGPLGRADVAVWQAIRRVVPPEVSLSVALGELPEWMGRPLPSCDAFSGVSYRKLGLAGTGPEWARTWEDLRERWRAGPSWVAVAYADWRTATAPAPDQVLDAALEATTVPVSLWIRGISLTQPRSIDRGSLGSSVPAPTA